MEKLIVLALLLSSTACGDADGEPCTGGSEHAIFHGSVEPPGETASAEEVRAIGALVDAQGNLFCTGTLIDRRWVLSAAHCSTDGLLFSPRHPDVAALKVQLGVVRYHARADLALAEVLEPEKLEAAGVRPLRARRRAIDELALFGTKATLAGVGRTETGALGELRFVAEEVVEVNAATIMVDGAGASGACAGDSGGPLLGRSASGAPEVLGTLTGGSASCLGRDEYVRLDVHADWLAESLGPEPDRDEPGSTPRALGGRCWHE